MTYDRAIRPRLRAWTAALLTALLVAGGLSFGATAAQAAPGDVASATLDWGVKASFRSYISGPIAAGGWTVDGGVTDATPFGWSGGSGSADEAGSTGSVSYPGSVHFVGHGGALDILFANLAIVQSSATAATLYVDTATATGVPLATLDLASGVNGSSAGSVAYSGVPAYLTADGATAFGGFYTEGTALDPVSFSWPVEQAAAPIVTSTALTVAPSATSVVGASVALTATITPAADGTVQFLDGATPLGAPVAVAAGLATYSDAAFALGAHSFSAAFTPTDAAAFAPSSAAAVAHTVTGTAVAAPASYDKGSATWGLSTYLNSANPGRPNPLASAYSAPAAFDAITRLTTWGGGSGTVKADGSATISYTGTSVNFAPTGGGWLTLSNLQATLDASGNGSVSAVASYGTAPGTYPNIVFDPAQTPTNGPARVTLVTLSGNAVGVSQGAGTASWAGLNGSWSPDFTAFLAGSGVTSAWSYATTVSSAAGRTPLAFSFDLGTVPPPAVATSVSLAASPAASVVLGTASTLTAAVSPAAAGTVEFRNGTAVLGSAAVTAGVATLAVTSLPVGSYSITAYFTPTDAAAFTASQSAALAYSVTAPVVAQAGSLIWGVKASLQSYVLGGGSIATSAGAGAYGSSFLFPQESSADFNQSTGTGTSSYRGQVTFAYPAHGFSISLSNPRVRADSATSGSLIVDVTYNGTTTSGVNFATLFLGAATKTSSAGSMTFTGAPAALTTAGAAAFQGFYSAGDSLDPVTFVVGAPAESFAATSAAAPAPRTPAATPPATTGITVTAGKPVAGGEVTVVAEGFEPGEEGILVVIYSEPTVLDANGKADANGTLTWTGRLPAALTGKHTLTFQGSVNRGVELDIAPRIATAAAGCPVDGATLTWGFKETFRSYISGSIANGEWTVADGATYTTPAFGWSGGTGAYDAKGGLVDFAGSVNFTGHGGILNTTIANPQLRFVDADTAILLLDVSGTTQDGAAVDKQDVEFVEIDLSDALDNADGTVTVTDAPTTLTPAGAEAFGTYEAGEPFDAVSFTLPLDSACAAPVAEPTETATVTAEPASSATDLTWLWIVIAAVLLLIVAAVVLIVVRRRRPA